MPLPLGLKIKPTKNYIKTFVRSIDNLDTEFKNMKKNKPSSPKHKKNKLKKTSKKIH